MTAEGPVFLTCCLAQLRPGLDASGTPCVLTALSVDRATCYIFAESLLDTDELRDIFTIQAQWSWEESGTSVL